MNHTKSSYISELLNNDAFFEKESGLNPKDFDCVVRTYKVIRLTDEKFGKDKEPCFLKKGKNMSYFSEFADIKDLKKSSLGWMAINMDKLVTARVSHHPVMGGEGSYSIKLKFDGGIEEILFFQKIESVEYFIKNILNMPI